MPERAAERRAQSALEYVALLGLVAAVLVATSAAIGRTDLAPLIGGRIGLVDAPAPVTAMTREELRRALRAEGDALSLLGARALVLDELGEERAAPVVATAVDEHLRAHHPAWFAALEVAPAHGPAGPLVAIPIGLPQVRLITPADEARHGLDAYDARGRMRAGATAIAWHGASSLANGLRRQLGLAVGAVRLLVAGTALHDPLPPGTRSGDLVACLPVRVGFPARPATMRPATRVAILRDDRILLDALNPDDRACAGPAEAMLSTGPTGPTSP